MKDPVTRLDYRQYLLVSQVNYTLTNFAEHSERFSHDQINRYLAGEKITPQTVVYPLGRSMKKHDWAWVVEGSCGMI